MNDSLFNAAPDRRTLPPLGQRIVKTSVAVFICLMIFSLRGYRGGDMPTESAITAIICMQPYVRDSREYAVNRVVGSLIGVFWGLVLLLVLYWAPSLGRSPLLLYSLMGLGVLVSLYGSVLAGKPDAASLAAIVFLCVVVAFPDITDPLRQALQRMVQVFIGTTVAIGVNVFRLPRVKNDRQVFFLHTKDLVPDRFAQISPTALFQLNSLTNDGARICLMSEHAPAFFMLQMHAVRLNVPLIVMDGAAVYDSSENRYLFAETIPREDSAPLRERLDALGLSYFIYTIHNDKTCIFHRGELHPEERTVYDHMRRSPYRSYLDGEICDPDEIVYFKLIAPEGEMEKLAHSLRHTMPRARLRSVIRPQAGSPGISGLYIYAHTATMEHAHARLMELLRREDPGLEAREFRLPGPYRSERDAIHLLARVSKAYQPVGLPKRKKKE